MVNLLAVHPQFDLHGDEAIIFLSQILETAEEHFNGVDYVLRVKANVCFSNREYITKVVSRSMQYKLAPTVFATVELGDLLIRQIGFPDVSPMWVDFPIKKARRVSEDFFSSIRVIDVRQCSCK